jgi:predicted MFS family arabinose efflux permease
VNAKAPVASSGFGRIWTAVSVSSTGTAVTEVALPLTAKNSLVQGTESVAQVAGPALGGVLVQLVGAARALLVDVASYLVSAACLMAVRPLAREEDSPAPGKLVPLVREGLSYVRRDPIVGPLIVAAAALNFTGAAVAALAAVFLVRTLHVDAALLGVLVSSAGAGGVLGAVAANLVVRRFGSARSTMAALLTAPVFAVLIPLAVPGAGLPEPTLLFG